jgi:hypothetical protein
MARGGTTMARGSRATGGTIMARGGKTTAHDHGDGQRGTTTATGGTTTWHNDGNRWHDDCATANAAVLLPPPQTAMPAPLLLSLLKQWQ